MIVFELPIKTVNESNGSHGKSHWPTTNRRKAQREAVAWALKGKTLPALPITVTCVRIGGTGLDKHDGLRSSFKSIVDEIAKTYGLPDKDDQFDWQYAQEKAPRGTYAVRIRIEERKP